jgi:hypothetical protein
MIITKPGPGQLIAAAGGALLIVSLFLPWATERTGWELLTMADVLLLLVGLVALGTALTGGRFGLFRPDLSLNGLADGLGVLTTILIAWFVIFDFPDGAGREVGVILALVAAAAVAGGAGDYSTLRGAPLFPRIGSGEQSGNVAASQQERGEGAEGGDEGGEHGDGLRAVHERPGEGARPA